MSSYVSRIAVTTGMYEWMVHSILLYCAFAALVIVYKLWTRITVERTIKVQTKHRDKWLRAYATRITIARSLSTHDILTKGYKSSLELAYEELCARDNWYSKGLLPDPLKDDICEILSCEEIFQRQYDVVLKKDTQSEEQVNKNES